MIRVVSETRIVWRSQVGRRGRLTKRAAYLDAAWEAWKAKYTCECDSDVGFSCGLHNFPYSAEERRAIDCGDMGSCEPSMAQTEWHDYRRKVVDRLARWLRWRDARLLAVAKEKRANGERLSLDELGAAIEAGRKNARRRKVAP